MKKLLLLLFPACMFMTVTSCGPSDAEKKEQDSLAAVHVKDSLRSNIENAEKALKSNQTYGANEVNACIKAYTDFTNKYPTDSLTPEYLMRASTKFGIIGNYSQSVAMLELIYDQHKDFKRYKEALMMGANIYGTYLATVNHGDDRAKELYNFVMSKYPDSPEAADAAILIKYIGVPADSMYTDIMRNNSSTGSGQK